MAATETLIERNAEFAKQSFTAGLRIMPLLRTIVIGCVDPRVDPNEVLGARPGEIAAIRNVGGRVTPDVLLELAMLRKVTQAAGGDLGPGWDVMVLHHTDCGITRLQDQRESLASLFAVEQEQVDGLAVGDPHKAVAIDVATLRGDDAVPGVRVSGLVYDVTTGVVETVVAPQPA